MAPDLKSVPGAIPIWRLFGLIAVVRPRCANRPTLHVDQRDHLSWCQMPTHREHTATHALMTHAIPNMSGFDVGGDGSLASETCVVKTSSPDNGVHIIGRRRTHTGIQMVFARNDFCTAEAGLPAQLDEEKYSHHNGEGTKRKRRSINLGKHGEPTARGFRIIYALPQRRT